MYIHTYTYTYYRFESRRSYSWGRTECYIYGADTYTTARLVPKADAITIVIIIITFIIIAYYHY